MMARDRELPRPFPKLNNFGVPNLGMLVATILPAFLVIAVKDLDALADLYAIGVVGAIAVQSRLKLQQPELDVVNWQ